MKKVPTYWWDFFWFRNDQGEEDFKIVVESDRLDGVEYVWVANIDAAQNYIADLNAGRKHWPKN